MNLRTGKKLLLTVALDLIGYAVRWACCASSVTVRFVLSARSARSAEDAMSRFIVRELDDAGIGVASATVDIVDIPELRTALREE